MKGVLNAETPLHEQTYTLNSKCYTQVVSLKNAKCLGNNKEGKHKLYVCQWITWKLVMYAISTIIIIIIIIILWAYCSCPYFVIGL
jgi:hypothetical protein